MRVVKKRVLEWRCFLVNKVTPPVFLSVCLSVCLYTYFFKVTDTLCLFVCQFVCPPLCPKNLKFLNFCSTSKWDPFLAPLRQSSADNIIISHESSQEKGFRIVLYFGNQGDSIRLFVFLFVCPTIFSKLLTLFVFFSVCLSDCPSTPLFKQPKLP